MESLAHPCPMIEILGPQAVPYVGDLFCGAVPQPILLFVCLHFLLQTRSRSDQVKKVASGANLYTDLALGDSACSFVNLSRLATLRENRLTS